MKSLTTRLLSLALYATVLFGFSEFLLSPVSAATLPITVSSSRLSSSGSAQRISKDPKTRLDRLRPLSRLALPRMLASKPVLTRAPPKHKNLDPQSQFATYYNAAKKNSQRIHQFATQSASQQTTDPSFQQQSTNEIQTFKANIVAMQGLLPELGAAEGLKYYDSSNNLERLLKGTVDLIKYTLNDLDVLVGNLPILGPVVEPIVDQVKCVLDLSLDSAENLTDAILNALRPLTGRAM